jgi:hypothetical protein
VAIGVDLVEHEGVQPDTAEHEPVQDPHRRMRPRHHVRHQEAVAAGRLAPRPGQPAERRPAVPLPPHQRHSYTRLNSRALLRGYCRWFNSWQREWPDGSYRSKATERGHRWCKALVGERRQHLMPSHH